MARASQQYAVAAAARAEILPVRAEAVGTRRRILETALIALSERGFFGITMREVANAAGIHVSSVYGHFPSKEMMLYELCLLGHEEHLERVTEAVEAAGDDLHAAITGYVRTHIHIHIRYQMLARVSNRELHALTGTRQKRIMRIRDKSAGLLLDLVAQATAEGVCHPQEPWISAVLVLGLGHRAAEWWSPDFGYSADEVEDVTVDAALRILEMGR